MPVLTLIVAGLLQAQDEGLSARDLFFDPRPVGTPKVSQSPPPKKQGVPAKKPVSITVGAVSVSSPAAKPAAVATMSMVQVDRAMKDCRDRANRPEPRWQDVPESTVFQPGQRVRLVMKANTEGFIYMFVRQSSGAFEDLYPLPEDLSAGEWKPVRAFEEAALPALCFTETKSEGEDNEIWILVTQNAGRAREFRDSLRKSGKGELVYAVNMALKQANGEMASRDIKRDEVPSARREGEPANAVYRKSSSRSGDQVFSIRLRQK